MDRTDTIGEDSPATIYVCQFPSLSAIELIRAGRMDAILIAVNLRWSTAALMANGQSFLEAIRANTATMTANRAIGATSRSRLVFPAFEQPSAATARSLLAHCGLPTDPATLSQVLSAMHGAELAQATLWEILTLTTPYSLGDALTPQQSTVVDKTLNGLGAMAQGDLTAPIIWPTDVFFFGDVPNTPVPAVAPVTGPSRVMAYGPYLHLPPGRYSVELTIAFAGRIEEIPFLLEFHAQNDCLARFRLEGRKSGGYRSRFSLTVNDPVAPIETRLRNERGAIEGEVSLVELRFKATDGPAS